MSRLDARSALLMTLPPLLWAGNAVVGRLLVASVPPLALNGLRWTLAALLLLPFGWRALRAPGALRGRWPYLLALGALGIGTYNAMQYLALVTSTPLNVTLIAASMPVCMLAVGVIGYGVHPTRREALGALLSSAGVLLVIARGDPGALGRLRFVAGDLYMVVATLAWSLYSWLLARPPQGYAGAGRPPLNWAGFLLVQMLVGIGVSGVAAGGEALVAGHSIDWSFGVALGLLYLAVGPSIVAYRCWGLGVARGGPALAAFFGNLTPLFAALLSAAVFGETPQAYHAAAFALIVAGIVVSARRG